MKRRVLLVAAKLGYQTRVFAEAGARLGYEVQLATDRCHVLDDPWGDGALALDFQAKTEHEVPGEYDGIVAVGDEPAEVAAGIAAAKGLPFHPKRAVAAARNKFLARERFAAAGLLTPAYRRVRVEDEEWSPEAFPCVLKPLAMSASRGVIRANNAREYHAARRRIAKMLPAGEEFLQVEEFLPGREYAVEGILTRGSLRVFAVFDKPDPLDGPYFEETIYVTPSRDGAVVIPAVEKAVAALGLWHGPVHAEVRVNDRGAFVLEAAGRPIGGLCAQVVRFASGRGLEEVILRHAVGEEEAETQRQGGSAVMMIPIPRRGVYRGVTGLEEALATPGIAGIEITAKEGQEMIPLPEGASYLGFLFAQAPSAKEAEEAVRGAHAKLRFDLAESLPLWSAG